MQAFIVFVVASVEREISSLEEEFESRENFSSFGEYIDI